MTKKVTKREMFNAIKDVLMGKEVQVTVDDIEAFIDHELELLDKKSSTKSGKPTATQVANEALKVEILTGLSETEGKTVSELIKSVEALSGLSNQKVSAVLRLMEKNDGTVRKETDKKKTLFYKVVAEA